MRYLWQSFVSFNGNIWACSYSEQDVDKQWRMGVSLFGLLLFGASSPWVRGPSSSNEDVWPSLGAIVIVVRRGADQRSRNDKRYTKVDEQPKKRWRWYSIRWQDCSDVEDGLLEFECRTEHLSRLSSCADESLWISNLLDAVDDKDDEIRWLRCWPLVVCRAYSVWEEATRQMETGQTDLQ